MPYQQAYDGRGPKTLLSPLGLERYGLHDPQELVRTIYGSELPRLARTALAELVEQAEGQADTAAIAILEESARELARAHAAVYPKLGRAAVPLIIAGGTKVS